MSTEAFRFRSDLEHAGFDIKGMSLIARDGEVGVVDDVVETPSGYVVLVNTGPFGFGKSRTVPAGLIAEIDEAERVVRVDASTDQVKEAPKFDEDFYGPDLETELLEHFEDVAAAPEPLERATQGLPQRHHQEETGPAPSSPLVAGPFASTEPEPPQREDEAFEDVVSAPADSDAPDAQVTRAATDSDAPDAQVTRAATDRPQIAGEPVSALGDAQAASEPTETPDTASTPGGESMPAPAAAIDRPEASSGATAESEAPSAPEAAETAEPAAPPRVERSSRSSKGGDTQARGTSRSSQRRSTGRTKRDGRDSLPIARYDSLNAGEILPRLRELAQAELTRIERYERKHENRKTLLERIEALRGDQPWRGYDNQNVADVKKKLAKAEPETVRFVRDYERKHKDRSGVVQAAQRRLEDA